MRATIDQFALDFAYQQCKRGHSRPKAHVCPDCQGLFRDVRKLATQWELELAKAVLKGDKDAAEIAREITAYPGQYTTITIIPGWMYRKLGPLIIFLILTLFGMAIAAGLS